MFSEIRKFSEDSLTELSGLGTVQIYRNIVEPAITIEVQLTLGFCVTYTNELLSGDRITTDFLVSRD